MSIFNLVAGIASILGLLLSGVAAVLARRASRAAAAARDAALVRTFADELQLASARAEQLVDFLLHDRFGEAALRSDELVYSLSELPYRRSSYLTETDKNSLLTARQQLQSISDGVPRKERGGSHAKTDARQSTVVARSVVISLREVLGQVRSRIESEVER